MINTAYKGITSSKGLESSKGLQSSTGIKSSGGLKSSTGIKASGGLDSHLPAPVDLRKTTVRRRNIDDPFDVFLSGRGGGAGSAQHPLQGYFQTVSGVRKVRIRNGDVNSVVPPEVQGGSAPVDYDDSDKVYWVDAEFDSMGVFTGPVVVGRGASLPANTATHAYRRIFEVSGGVILQSVTSSLEVASCGVGVYSWGSV